MKNQFEYWTIRFKTYEAVVGSIAALVPRSFGIESRSSVRKRPGQLGTPEELIDKEEKISHQFFKIFDEGYELASSSMNIVH